MTKQTTRLSRCTLGLCKVLINSAITAARGSSHPSGPNLQTLMQENGTNPRLKAVIVTVDWSALLFQKLQYKLCWNVTPNMPVSWALSTKANCSQRTWGSTIYVNVHQT